MLKASLRRFSWYVIGFMANKYFVSFIKGCWSLLLMALCSSLMISCNGYNDLDLCANLSFSQEGDTCFAIHPFASEDTIVLVIPAYWDNSKIVVRMKDGVCSIDGKDIDQQWKAMSVSSSAIKTVKVSFRTTNLVVHQSRLDAISIMTSRRNLEYITKTQADSGLIAAISSEGKVEYKGKMERLRGRGNCSWLNHEKKPYSLKLDKKKSLFGLRKGKIFNLLAEASDQTKVHNWLAFHIAEDFGMRYPIHCLHVALWINGDYCGIYLLTEPVEVSRDGIDINDLEADNRKSNGRKFSEFDMQKLNKNGEVMSDTCSIRQAWLTGVTSAINPEDITGGYVVEFPVPWTKEPDNQFCTRKAAFSLKSPKYPTIEQMSYLQERMDRMIGAVMDNWRNPEADDNEFLYYLDIDSYARYYLVQELLYNGDACYASVYHVKDCDSVDSLFYAAPLWDMDWSMSPLYGDSINEAKCYRLRPAPLNTLLIFPDLWRYPCFQDTVKSLYRSSLSPLLHKYYSTQMSDSLRNLLEGDLELDKVRWAESYSVKQEYSAMCRFMNNRVNYVDKDLFQSDSAYYVINVDFGEVDRPYIWHVQRGDSFHMPQRESDWFNLDAIVDDIGNAYVGDFVPSSNVNLHYHWRELTRMEKVRRKIQKWIK